MPVLHEKKRKLTHTQPCSIRVLTKKFRKRGINHPCVDSSTYNKMANKIIYIAPISKDGENLEFMS